MLLLWSGSFLVVVVYLGASILGGTSIVVAKASQKALVKWPWVPFKAVA